ncbi:MAG TPA: hypothetical protein VIV11_30280 [Kofleriaceae bacterium]
MLRGVLVGLLAVSAVSCKSSSDSAKSQPGMAAGKVVEVTGSVTVRHNNVAQPLAAGATVEGDDIIETGADGNVIIELNHNLVRWELGANKTAKVKESVAWGLAKKAGDSVQVTETSAAAGRNAERSAADTTVSAQAESAPAPTAAPVAPPPPPPPAPPAEAQSPRQEAPPKAKKAEPVVDRERDDAVLNQPSGGGGAPTKELAKTRGGEGAAGGTGTASTTVAKGAPGGGANVAANADTESAKMSPADADKAAMDVVLKNDKALKACLTKDAQALSVTIKIAANGKGTAVVSGKAAIPGSVQTCVKSAVAKMKFAAVATTVKVEVSR